MPNTLKPIILLTIAALLLAGRTQSATVTFAGARSSYYGARPWPDNQEWGNILLNMAAFFGDDCTPLAIWIVGGINQNSNSCMLEFPAEGRSYPKITFASNDKHEPILDYFDQIGARVILQVESGDADILDCIDAVLGQYSHHPSVAGFGIDNEWYFVSQGEWGIPVTDDKARAWDEKIKSYNPDYRLMLKHWETNRMPDTYRGTDNDMIFVNDAQGTNSFDEHCSYMARWADYFAPCCAGVQTGYPNNESWWGNLDNPPKQIGEGVAARAGDTNQEIFIAWVDFSLRNSKIEGLLFDDIQPTAIARSFAVAPADRKPARWSKALSGAFAGPSHAGHSGYLRLLTANGRTVTVDPTHARLPAAAYVIEVVQTNRRMSAVRGRAAQ
ncbi:MAG: hypothetical protein GF350_13395 [Chitinivibrionales bacterium]|nr:hypothetical protein [Chitinivibrionales bacterium]